jgi:hypothetical protein
MQTTPRRDPDWEHWPGRPTDDGEERVRSRLRALFLPTEAENAITELLAEHTRELETRASELRSSMTELERREGRTRELHARVEQVLRGGSAELDVRHSELVVRATELDRRETEIAQAELQVEERARAFGAVELRGAVVERRERVLRDGQADLDKREAELRKREWNVAMREVELGSDETPGLDAPADMYVAFTLEDGYRLVEQDGAVPAPGDIVELETGMHRCLRVTASPYPSDRRRCAVLERIASTAA